MDQQDQLPDNSNQTAASDNNSHDASQFEQNEPLHHKHAKIVLILFSILLIGIIFTLVYFLTQENEEVIDYGNTATQEVPEQAQEVPQEPEVPEVSSISEDWLEFTSIEYKLKLPDGWSFVHQDNGVLIYSCDGIVDGCYVVVDGERATVEEVIGGRDGLQGLLVTIQSEGYSIDDITQGYDKVGDSVNGFAIYKRIQTEEPVEQEVGSVYPVGTVEYVAVKQVLSGRVAYIGYSVIPGQEDPTIGTIPEVLQSFTVLNQ